MTDQEIRALAEKQLEWAVALRRRLQDDLCWKYLDCAARFDCRTLPGYRPQRLRMLQFACTPRRRAKAALFALSPELFRRVMNH